MCSFYTRRNLPHLLFSSSDRSIDRLMSRFFDNAALYEHMTGTHINCHLCPEENQHRCVGRGKGGPCIDFYVFFLSSCLSLLPSSPYWGMCSFFMFKAPFSRIWGG